MTILRYGGRGGDWGKSHTKCADTSPDVMKVGASVAEQTPATPNPIATGTVDYVELARGEYVGLNKYAIRVNGEYVWFTSDRKRAEGAVFGALAVLQRGTPST